MVVGAFVSITGQLITSQSNTHFLFHAYARYVGGIQAIFDGRLAEWILADLHQTMRRVEDYFHDKGCAL